MSSHVHQAMATFVSDAELTDEEWVQNYMASNSLQVQEGVLDLSGVVISNVVDILCQPREPVTSGTVHSVYYDCLFDCLVSEAPPAGVIPGYVQFTSGALSGQVFAIEGCSSGSWNGSGYFVYELPNNSLQQLVGGEKYRAFRFEPIHDSFVRKSGDTMHGSLSIGKSLEVIGAVTIGSDLMVEGTVSVGAPTLSNHAVNLAAMQSHVDTALAVFADEAELADQTWVSGYVSSNSLQVQEGVLDLSGVVISNVVDIFCQPQEPVGSGSVHSVASFCDNCFDVLLSEAPPEWEPPTHVLFISGLLSGQVYEVSSSSSGSCNGSGYHAFGVVGAFSSNLVSGDGYLTYRLEPLHDSFVRKTGDTVAGPLSLTYTPTADTHATSKGYVDSSFKGFDYDARYIYVDKYYYGGNGYDGSLQAPYTNFYHALTCMGSNSFFGGECATNIPVVYHVGHGYYKFPPLELVGVDHYMRVGLIGRGAF
jgi:hypothetical protein